MADPMDDHFYALVHKDAGSAFGVSFPDLPGCFSAADTFETIVPNATEAIALWFEGRDDLAPRSLEALAPDVGADIVDGAFLIAIPRRQYPGGNDK